MRKFFFTFVLLFSFITLSYAQHTVSIGAIAAPEVNSTVVVPINVTNFNDVGAITLKIQYNDAALEFVSVSRSPEFIAGANNGVVSIARADFNAVTPVNGTLVEITFTYLGGNSDLTFTSECEIATTTGIVIPGVDFVSGEVTEPCDMKIELGAVSGTTIGAQISVPVNVTAFDGVGAITLKIRYDISVLEFVSVSRSSEFIAGANNGVVSIARADFNAVTPANGKLVDINFTYLGGSADLTFDSGNEIANTSGVVFECVNYTPGSVTEVLNNPPSFTASLSNTTIAEGQTLTFNYDVADPDTADELTFTVESPEDATIDASSGLFTWTPGFDAAGEHDVVVTISDGTVSVSDTAVVTVTNTNRAPAFTDSLESITDGETGQEITFTYSATDPDDDDLTFSLVSGPAGAEIDAQTGVLTYTLGEIDTVTITVSVTDGEATVTTTATVAIVTSIKNNGGLPTEYALSQNFPNPFNPTTKIKFSLPSESHVTLNVYNLLGEQVASLLNTFLPASNYEFNFDASNLTSGIYIYKLQAGEFVTSKKMTLVK